MGAMRIGMTKLFMDELRWGSVWMKAKSLSYGELALYESHHSTLEA